MLHSILDERNRLLSYPLRKFAPWIQDTLESDNPRIAYSGMAIMAMAATPTFIGNVLFPLHMIGMGFRPYPVLEGITYAKNATGYPMPVWNMFHGASPAYKAGERVGRGVGAFLSPSLHTVTTVDFFGRTKTLAKSGRSGARLGAKIGGRVGARVIPGVGWALLAYDVYDLAYNRSIWGFDL